MSAVRAPVGQIRAESVFPQPAPDKNGSHNCQGLVQHRHEGSLVQTLRLSRARPQTLHRSHALEAALLPRFCFMPDGHPSVHSLESPTAHSGSPSPGLEGDSPKSHHDGLITPKP